MNSAENALLEISGLTVHYGKARALDKISLHVNQGEIVCIVGANGAGKTTAIRTISGSKHPTSGEIFFDGKRVDEMPAYHVVRLGIVQVPAGRQIFQTMSVLDNLKVGAHRRRDREGIKRDLESVYEHFPILRDKRNQAGGELSGGQQQMLAVGRALMANPRLLLMDEPSIGLSPILVAEVGKIIKDINRRGISILLVEQNARLALRLSNRAYILELGRIGLQGHCEDLIDNAEVKRCYLGATGAAS
ncbi:MAG TPA: ABC transporter ATP-binding protein [Thermoleophilia bacterium]|nr:ABC transporter ATP-binding protein [Thermoleophilia bacterium]